MKVREILSVAGAGLLICGVAAAQPKKDEPTGDEKKDEAPKVKVERGAGGKKVYRITQGFVIEGRIQKPNAFYVLQRSQINYDWAGLKQKFVPQMSQSAASWRGTFRRPVEWK